MRRRFAMTAGDFCLCVALFSGASRCCAADTYTMVVEKIVMHKTPQSGTWLFCFKLKQGDNEATYHVANKEYEGDGITIQMDLEITDIERASEVTWWMGLDDDEADVCSEQAEDKAVAR